jgi:hypothetical protein
LFLFLAARKRSEATMRSNHFGNTIFGITITGQGITNVVEGTHGVVLRHLLSFARRLSSCLASWRAFKCMPGAAMPAARMAPAMAMCPCYSDRRCQRVVETRGTVGVC